MTLPTSHREIIGLLGAQQLAALPGCSYGRVRRWLDRDRIAGNWVVKVSVFARENGHPEITPELLDRIASEHRRSESPRTCTRAGEAA